MAQHGNENIERMARHRASVRTYVDAVNSKDLQRILYLFASDAEVHDPVGRKEYAGMVRLRAFYEAVIERVHLEIAGTIRGSHANAVAVPLRAHVPGFIIDVISVVTFDDRGLIKHYAAYWDPSDKREAGGSAE